MNDSRPLTVNIEEFKIRASLLLKALRSNDSNKFQEAARRFQRLPGFSAFSISKIIETRSEIKRKHALEVIALENLYPSWRALRAAVSALPHLANHSAREKVQSRKNNKDDGLYLKGGYLHPWFAHYEEAKEYLDREGGYLLVHGDHFFIAGADYIVALGLDPADPDWDQIGKNWAKPEDSTAWARLNSKLASRKTRGSPC